MIIILASYHISLGLIPAFCYGRNTHVYHAFWLQYRLYMSRVAIKRKTRLWSASLVSVKLGERTDINAWPTESYPERIISLAVSTFIIFFSCFKEKACLSYVGNMHSVRGVDLPVYEDPGILNMQ